MSDKDIRVQFPVDPRLILKYGEVTSVDPESKLVHFENDDPLSYDWLVIALGCVDKYHNITGAKEFSNSIQTLSATRKTYQAPTILPPTVKLQSSEAASAAWRWRPSSGKAGPI